MTGSAHPSASPAGEHCGVGSGTSTRLTSHLAGAAAAAAGCAAAGAARGGATGACAAAGRGAAGPTGRGGMFRLLPLCSCRIRRTPGCRVVMVYPQLRRHRLAYQHPFALDLARREPLLLDLREHGACELLVRELARFLAVRVLSLVVFLDEVAGVVH